MFPENALIPRAEIRVNDIRYANLLRSALARIPKDVLPIRTVARVNLSKRSTNREFAGLTKYRYPVKEQNQEHAGRFDVGRQTITLYTELLDQLSDGAALAVVAHELAHAWLNEHKVPEESESREKEADDLARRWGFGRELAALNREVD